MLKLDLSDVHWTSVTRGPRSTRIVVCTHDDCGFLGAFAEYSEALEYARAHAANPPSDDDVIVVTDALR